MTERLRVKKSHTTRGVLLRDVTQEDLPIFFEHQADPESFEMAGFTPRERDAFEAHWAKILGNESIATKTILFDGHVAGNVVCFERLGVREVGYWIGKEYWGKGIATSALSQLLGLVGARPLYARVAKHNIGSIRVLEKCGFELVDEQQGPPDAHGEEVTEVVLKLEKTMR